MCTFQNDIRVAGRSETPLAEILGSWTCKSVCFLTRSAAEARLSPEGAFQ